MWCARQAGSNVECAGKALPTARHAGCGARPRCSKTGLPWPLGLDRWWDMRASLGGGANSYPQDGRVLVGAARWRPVSWTVSSIGIRQGIRRARWRCPVASRPPPAKPRPAKRPKAKLPKAKAAWQRPSREMRRLRQRRRPRSGLTNQSRVGNEEFSPLPCRAQRDHCSLHSGCLRKRACCSSTWARRST